MEAMHLFASTEAAAENSGLFGALGIDWRLLVIQAIAFLILLWVLSKFVYPVISGMLDKREATIREGMEAAQKAEENAEAANEKVDKLLSDARKQANEAIVSAKDEAASIVAAANASASKQTEKMLERATAEIEKEVESARKALRAETIDLVSLATEKVIGEVMTEKVDKKIVASAVKEAERA